MHTATVLNNGQVLIAGGLSAPGVSLSDAEIYDPTTGTFRQVMNRMTVRRNFHTAERMRDGRVILVGGDDGTRAVENSEIFTPGSDPALTGTFASVSGSPGLSDIGTSQLLNGDIMVTGGHREGLTGGYCSCTATRISPQSDGTLSYSWSGYRYTWTAGTAAPVAVCVGGQAQTTMESGFVLMAGGWCGGWSMHSGFWENASIYDPTTMVWAEVSPMAVQRYGFTLTSLRGGNVLAVGGLGDSSALRSTEVFHAPRGPFSAGPDMAVQREFHRSIRLDPTHSAYVMICGGEDASGGRTPVTEIYGEVENRMYRVSDMAQARSQHTATRLSDGRVLIVGGRSASAALSSAEIFLPGP